MRAKESETGRRQILTVCSDTSNIQAIESAISGWMIELVVCLSLRESQSILATQEIDVIFCEDCFEGGTYRDLLDLVRNRKVPVVLIMDDAKREALYSEAMSLGAFDALASPSSKRDVQWMMIRAIESIPAAHRPRGLRA